VGFFILAVNWGGLGRTMQLSPSHPYGVHPPHPSMDGLIWLLAPLSAPLPRRLPGLLVREIPLLAFAVRDLPTYLPPFLQPRTSTLDVDRTRPRVSFPYPLLSDPDKTPAPYGFARATRPAHIARLDRRAPPDGTPSATIAQPRQRDPRSPSFKTSESRYRVPSDGHGLLCELHTP